MQISSALAFLPPTLPSTATPSYPFSSFSITYYYRAARTGEPIRPVFVPRVCEFHCKLERTVAQAPGDRGSLNRVCTVREGRRKWLCIYLSVKVRDGSEIGLAESVSEIAGKIAPPWSEET